MPRMQGQAAIYRHNACMSPLQHALRRELFGMRRVFGAGATVLQMSALREDIAHDRRCGEEPERRGRRAELPVMQVADDTADVAAAGLLPGLRGMGQQAGTVPAMRGRHEPDVTLVFARWRCWVNNWIDICGFAVL